MKKIVIFALFSVLFLAEGVFALELKDITGRWTECISKHTVMDIYTDKDNSEYHFFITQKEDNSFRKDIYRFMAKPDKNGNLEYKNGIHIYRMYEDKNKFEDKTVYVNGFGLIKVKNNELIWVNNKDKTETAFIRANKDLIKDTTVKNKLFSITLPEELKGLYEIEKTKDRISVFHTESKKAGFGGFAFGIKAYKNPKDHAVLPGSRKIGELTDRKGTLYDMVLKYPTDVQFDYTKTQKAPESYKILYNLGEIININNVKKSTYYKNQGMRGEDLYKDVLKKHLTAINEKWDSVKLEKENMSYMYNVLAQTDKNVSKKIGYAYYDVNGDGTDELFVGEIAKGSWKGVVYDIYTMVNRKPKHVISGGARNRYYVCDNAFVCREYSSGALESGFTVYNLVENSTELYPQVSFKYDGYTNPKNPWFLSYGIEKDEGEWENVSEEKYKDRKRIFEKYERFNYTPIGNFRP